MVTPVRWVCADCGRLHAAGESGNVLPIHDVGLRCRACWSAASEVEREAGRVGAMLRIPDEGDDRGPPIGAPREPVPVRPRQPWPPPPYCSPETQAAIQAEHRAAIERGNAAKRARRAAQENR